MHYTPEHCLVNGGFSLFWWKKQRVSNGQHVSFEELCPLSFLKHHLLAVQVERFVSVCVVWFLCAAWHDGMVMTGTHTLASLLRELLALG